LFSVSPEATALSLFRRRIPPFRFTGQNLQGGFRSFLDSERGGKKLIKKLWGPNTKLLRTTEKNLDSRTGDSRRNADYGRMFGGRCWEKGLRNFRLRELFFGRVLSLAVADSCFPDCPEKGKGPVAHDIVDGHSQARPGIGASGPKSSAAVGKRDQRRFLFFRATLCGCGRAGKVRPNFIGRFFFRSVRDRTIAHPRAPNGLR